MKTLGPGVEHAFAHILLLISHRFIKANCGRANNAANNSSLNLHGILQFKCYHIAQNIK